MNKQTDLTPEISSVFIQETLPEHEQLTRSFVVVVAAVRSFAASHYLLITQLFNAFGAEKSPAPTQE